MRRGEGVSALVAATVVAHVEGRGREGRVGSWKERRVGVGGKGCGEGGGGWWFGCGERMRREGDYVRLCGGFVSV